MIADLKPYPEYMESRLPWLGKVPGHWGLIPNRGLVRKRKVLVGKRHSDYRLLSLTKQGVIVRDISTGKGKFSSDMGTSQEVRNGDLVFCLFDVPETPRTVGLSRHDGMITGAYTVFESLGRGSSEYFELFYRAMDDRKLLSPLYSGLRNTISAERFLGTKTPQPPSDEQAAIVRFLDWANGRLEQAIRAKRKVIALLNEQKQAIIHRAVTRGLDPPVPLKPSGIPWLGDIPAHWEIRRAKYLYREVDERSTDGSEELLSVSHITGVTPRSQKNITMFKAASYKGHKLCRPGDLVVNTMWAWMGALGVSTHAGIISPAYAVYRPRRPEYIVGIYMDGLLRSRPYVSNIICRSTGLRASRLRLYPEEFFRLPIIQPPAKEQQRIVEYIHEETAELDTAISRLEREIELLREYRTRLVADVVTGKLDVRAAAAKLPEESDDLEPLDDADALTEGDEETGDADLDAVIQEAEA
jgi:type I restriction enzyme S subunit